MKDGLQKCAYRQSVCCNLPVPLLGALLGVPQGSPFLDVPSPKGSLDGEDSEGGAGEPHASSELTGAAAKQRNRPDMLNQYKSVVYRQIHLFSLMAFVFLELKVHLLSFFRYFNHISWPSSANGTKLSSNDLCMKLQLCNTWLYMEEIVISVSLQR